MLTGQRLLLVGTALVLSTSLSIATRATAADTPSPQDCTLHRYTSIDLAVRAGAIPMVPVMIDGTRYFMLLQIDAAYSLIYERAATSLRLDTKSIIGAGIQVGDKLATTSAFVPTFSLGELKIKNMDMIVIKESADSKKNTQWLNGLTNTMEPVFSPDAFIGFLGADVFAATDVELDLANRKLSLYSQDHCPGRVVYWANDFSSVPLYRDDLGVNYFPIELEGKPIEAVLATTRLSTDLTTDATEALYGFDKKSTSVETELFPNGERLAQYRAMELTANGLSVMNARVRVLDPLPQCLAFRKTTGRAHAAGYGDCLDVHPLHLGLNVLSKLHLYIANKEKVLYFTAADSSR